MKNDGHSTLNEQEFSQAIEELDEDLLAGVQGGTKRPLFDINVPPPPEPASEPAPKRLKLTIETPTQHVATSRPLGQPDSPTFKDLPEITKLPKINSPKIW